MDKDVVYNIIEYYSAIIFFFLPFAVTWMDLEDIMLNDISRTEKERQVLYDITYLESKQYNKLMSITNRSKFTNKQPISGYQ